LSYRWSTAGGYGVIADGIGGSGASFLSKSASVTFTANPSVPNGATKPVSVDITDVTDGANIDLGIAAATITLQTIPANGVTVTLTNLTSDINAVLLVAGTYTGLLGHLGVNYGNNGVNTAAVVAYNSAGTFGNGSNWPLGGEVKASIALAWQGATISNGGSVPITEFLSPTGTGCTFQLFNSVATPSGYAGTSGTFTILSLGATTAVVHIQAHMVGSETGLTGDYEFDIDILGTVLYSQGGNVP
jgi:hypothetical protein